MKKRLVRLCYNLGRHGLACKISPAVYHALVWETVGLRSTEAADAITGFMDGLSEGLQQKKADKNDAN